MTEEFFYKAKITFALGGKLSPPQNESLFLKLKIAIGREEISDQEWNYGECEEAANGD